MQWSQVVILLLGFILVHSKEEYPKVKTPLGNIKGYYKRTENGKLYEAYEGIPYAFPPTGNLRFEAPKKIIPWIGELQATKKSDACLQYFHIPITANDKVIGSEDCLYLNIYAPIRERVDLPVPVIFWIHGGCFQYGSGSDYGAKYIADEDVILVTINYRLGSLGFLSTQDDIVSGNMGLKDQSMALHWVHDNIASFGGDPSKITLTGLSAGGASVHYQYLTPLSAGLFQNGISFSGTALLSWAQTEKSDEKARKLGVLMGCPTENTKIMIKCLKLRPARPLVQATSAFMPWLYYPYTPFGPVIEKSIDGYFINKSPVEIITSGEVQDVPWITGVVSEEGLYPAADFVADDALLKHLNDNWDLVATHLLDYNYTLSKNKHSEVANQIRKHYLGTKLIDRSTINPIIQLVGDRLFVIDAEKAARLQAKSNKQPVWFYYYSYRAAESLSDFMSGTKTNFGVCHADDALLVIEQHIINPTTTESDKAMQKNLLRFWISVAVEGKPDFGVEWPRVNPDNENFNYLHISGPGQFRMENNDNLGERKFWNTIPFDENRIKLGLREDL